MPSHARHSPKTAVVLDVCDVGDDGLDFFGDEAGDESMQSTVVSVDDASCNLCHDGNAGVAATCFLQK